MRRRRVAAAMLAATFALSATAGVANAESQTMDERAQINEFVQEVHSEYGLTVDPSDYEVHKSEQGYTTVSRKGAPSPKVQTRVVDDEGTTEVTVTPGAIALPTEAERQQQREEGTVGIQQETVWYQPNCDAVFETEHGWMLACTKVGDMNYQGQTRNNWVVHVYGSCRNADDAWHTELVECNVWTKPDPSNTAQLYWNDQSPNQNVSLDPCGQVNLSIGFGPVTAGGSYSTCGEVVPFGAALLPT